MSDWTSERVRLMLDSCLPLSYGTSDGRLYVTDRYALVVLEKAVQFSADDQPGGASGPMTAQHMKRANEWLAYAAFAAVPIDAEKLAAQLMPWPCPKCGDTRREDCDCGAGPGKVLPEDAEWCADCDGEGWAKCQRCSRYVPTKWCSAIFDLERATGPRRAGLLEAGAEISAGIFNVGPAAALSGRKRMTDAPCLGLIGRGWSFLLIGMTDDTEPERTIDLLGCAVPR